MQSFHTSTFANGPSDSILDSAVRTLTHLGFAIRSRTVDSVTLDGPGLNSTRQNPLLGATTITLRAIGQKVEAVADLGGVEKLQTFISRFPLILGLVLSLFFGVGGGFLFGQVFNVGFGVPWAQGWHWLILAAAVGLLPVSPWVFISPAMSRSIQRNTEDAIVRLLREETVPF